MRCVRCVFNHLLNSFVQLYYNELILSRAAQNVLRDDLFRCEINKA